MTELPEVSTSQGQVLTTINDNFQSASPAAAFGIDWRNTEALTLGVFGGIAPDGTEIAAQTKALTGSQTNYVEMTTAGVVSVNTSAYTAGRVKLFRIVTNANGITGYTDDRSYSPGGLYFAGPSTDNAIARFDGTTGKLQNSVVTISDLGAIAGAISLTIDSGTLTDSAPAINVTQTWNDAADTFIGADMNITSTASAAASLLERWRVGGVVMASISKAGAMVLAAGLTLGAQLSIASGTLTDPAAAISTSQTWNDAADTFVGADMSITDTNSAAGSLLQRWQVGGASKFEIRKNGAVGIGGVSSTSAVVNLVTTPGFTSATQRGMFFNVTFSANATTAVEPFRSSPVLADGSGVTYAKVDHFRAVNISKLGASDTVTAQAGFSADSGMASAALNLGFEGKLTVSGTARYNLYMSGTAPNYLAGQLFVGYTAGVTIGQSNKVQISGDGSTAGGLSLSRYSADALGTRLEFSKSRHATIGSNTIAQSGDALGSITWYGADGTDYDAAAQIIAEVDGTPGSGTDMPGRLRFLTSADGTATLTERLRIDNAGNVVVNTAAIATNAANGFLYVPSCAGTPTGTPTTYTGRVPIVVDTTNHKIYFYDGSWRDAGP